MHSRRRVVADSNGSPRLTQTGRPLQAAKLRNGDNKSEAISSESNHQEQWHSPEPQQRRVDSVIDSSQRNTRPPPCTKHTIRHCYCKSPQIFRNLSQEDWKTHVRPVMSPQRRNFGEPYDTFRRPLSRFQGGSVFFESRDKSNRFEVKTPPDLEGFYDRFGDQRYTRSWAPVDYGENGWGKTSQCPENPEHREGVQWGQNDEWNNSAFHSGYEDIEVAPENVEPDHSSDLVIEWLQGQLIAERRRNAALEKRVRTLEEECSDPYC